MGCRRPVVTDDELLPPMLRIADVARLLNISRSHCYRLAVVGVLPSVRLGTSVRIPRRQLLEWISAQAASRNA